jgi:hypothetical protein
MLFLAVLKYLWALPASLLGAVAAAAACCAGARLAVHTGVVELTFPAGSLRALKRALPFDAITLGHVVLAVSPEAQARLRTHERVHVRQYEVWGPFFLLTYPLESLFQLLIGRRPYVDNRFEVQARSFSEPQNPGTV